MSPYMSHDPVMAAIGRIGALSVAAAAAVAVSLAAAEARANPDVRVETTIACEG